MSDDKNAPNFSALTENLNQQQAKISALKELVRQSESQHGRNTASAQEKVKNIAQRLSNLKSKASKSKLHRTSSEVSEDYSITHYEEEENEVAAPPTAAAAAANIPTTSRAARSETPGSEKITLLRKQMELNRMKMAERENKSKEIEQMVTQLKSRFETSQMSLEKSVELGRSMGDLSSPVPSMLLYSQNRSVSDVSHGTSQPLNFENERIQFLEKRIRELESTAGDRENSLSETEAVQQLERKIIDLEETIKEKESIIDARTRAVSLLTENLSKKKKNVVDSLEDTKQEMFKMQETFIETELAYRKDKDRLQKLLDEKSNEITNLNEKNEILEKSRYELTIENSDIKSKLEEVQDYSTKISELNKLNESLQKRISTLESQRYEFITEDEVGEAKTAEGQTDWSQKVEELERLLKERDEEIEKLQDNLQEKTVEADVVNANMAVLQEKYNALSQKPLFAEDSGAADEETAKIKQQLDDSNKSMIKTKLKMKQMQKQIDTLQKSSDGSQEIARLNEEIQTLNLRIAELEEEKGSYQLQLVGNESHSDLEQKLKVLETTCQNQNAAIQLLEEQKTEMSDDLQKVKEDASRVTELEARISDLESLNNDQEHKIHQVTEEKEALSAQMNQYLNENMELLDKLEKISKGSSAESIEMVANLTAQEKLEIEEYQKGIEHKEEEVPIEISQELNESLRSLRMESSELMEKIELFTIERREVLEKLDALTVENQVLTGNYDKLQEEKSELEQKLAGLLSEKEDYEATVLNLNTEKNGLNQRLAELSEHRTKLQEEINKLVKAELSASSPHGSPLKTAESTTESDQSSSSPSKEAAASSIDREACEKLLKQLDSEIQNLNRNKDKNQKLKISKKISDNAKNVHAMMTNLLIEFYKNLDDCKQLREDLEKVKVLLNNVSCDRNNEEIQNLHSQLAEVSEKLTAKHDECASLEMRLNEISKSNEDEINLELEQLKSELENAVEQAGRKDSLIATLQDTIDALTTERDRYESEVQKQMGLVSELRIEFDQLCADVKVNNQRLNEKSAELDQLQHEFDMRLKTSTSEVEILKTLVAEQKQLLIDAYQEHELDINQKIKEISDYENQVKQLTQELEALKSANAAHQESYADDLKVEIKKLKDLLNESNREIETQKEALLHKQETIDTLNTQIIELYKSMEENANRVVEKEDEIQYLQEIADSNREEIRKAHDKLTAADKTIDDLRSQLSGKAREMEMLQQKAAATPEHDPKVDEKVRQLEAEVKSLDAKNKEQHDKLKKYAANLKKKQAQCTELEEKLNARASVDTIDSSVVNELKAKVVQYEEQINLIRVENSKLNESIQQSSANDEIDDLRWKIDEYESMVADKSKEIANLQNQLQQLSNKCDQIEEGSFELQSQIQKLENERDKLKENSEVLANELNAVKREKEELASKPAEADNKSEERKKMEKLKAAAVQLKHKLADKKKEVEELQAEIAALKSTPQPTQEVESLQQQIKQLDEMSEKILSETKVAYDNDIGLLRQKIEELESSNRLLVEEKQRKVSLEGQLETFEMTNIELREKVARLEETVASFDAEKNSLIREKVSLERELEEKDELIGRKLRETEADNHQLNETIRALNEERNALLQKMSAIEMQLAAESERSSLQVSNYESDNSQLQQQIENLHADIKKHQVAHEQALATKHAEIDEMEGQFSSQLQKVESEKKSVQEALEKANDQIVDYQDEIIRLRDNAHSLEQARTDLEREMSWLKLQNDNYTQDQLENEQLRMQLMQSETELENLRSQNETIISNHDAEVLILRQQIADLEAMRSQVSQNQTDDQVMLQNENVKLKELLIEKENLIQQKAMQLQMATMFEAPVQVVSDPFASLQASAPPPSSDPNDVSSLQDRLRQAIEEMDRLREAHMMTNMELDMQAGKIQELMNENRRLQEKTHEMQAMMDNLIRTNVDLEAAHERQKSDIEMKDREINEIKNEMSALRDHYSTQSTDDDKLHPEVHSLQNELIEKNRAIENLQDILHRYESQPAAASHTAPAPAPQPMSISMFFDDPQPSTSSLFDDPFSLPPPVVEEVIRPKKAYVYNEQLSSNTEVQTDEQWLLEHQENVNRIVNLQSQLQAMEQRIMEQYMELEAQRQRIVELEANQKPPQGVLPHTELECIAKKAYLCHENSNTAETQTDFELFCKCIARIHQLEAEIASMQQQQRPVVEAEIPKPAQAQQQLASFFDSPVDELEIEDTWGWGSENASAVQEIAQLQQVQPLQTSLLSPRSDLEVRLQEQRDIVERLESEKSALNEELHGLRENSKKMMKKLKEYQQKIKDIEASKRRSSSFESEMDLVIQEELKSQVQKLETRLKEINGEREKEQHEKEALNKKLEVLSNANDRMVEMKERQDGQMEMYQLKIKDLNQKLQNLEEWGSDERKVEAVQVTSAPSGNHEELNKKIKDLSDQLKDMSVDNEELQALLDEEKSNNKILEEKLAKISSEQSFNDATKDDEIQRLSQQLSFSHAQCEALNHQISSKNHEIQELVSKIDQLSHDSVSIRGFLDDLRSQVQQKTDENQALNGRLQKLEDNNDELSHERQLYNQSVEHQYQQQLQELEGRVHVLHGELEYKAAQVGILTEKNEELLREISQIKGDLSAKDGEIASLKARATETPPTVALSDEDPSAKLSHLERVNAELTKEKSQMEHELQVLNDQVLASLEFEDRMKNTVLEVDAKNMEIQMLKATIEKMQSKPPQAIDNSEEIEKLRHEKEDLERSMQSSIDLLNAQWSQMVEQRGNEVANSWKQHLEHREAEFAEIEANLRASLAQHTPDSNSEAKAVDNSDTMLKMKSIMESQEVEIVSLKEQLAIRSAEFAALSARVDPYNQMTTSMSVSPVPAIDTDKVPRSELDLALYMLHQRDMRLEEITMELVRLLEERDTLQLRLSNAIRQIEEIKKKFNIEAAESSDQSTPEKQPAKVEDAQLQAKLSELNTIRHMRDKDFADEREKRFVEHMSMFQRDVANIPPEAAARIVSGSDQNQSPSSVLMNWILGKKPEDS